MCGSVHQRGVAVSKESMISLSFPGWVVLIGLAEKSKRHCEESAKLDAISSSVCLLLDVRQIQWKPSDAVFEEAFSRTSVLNPPTVPMWAFIRLKQTDFVEAAISHRDNRASYRTLIKPLSGWGVCVCTLDAVWRSPLICFRQPMELNGLILFIYSFRFFWPNNQDFYPQF